MHKKEVETFFNWFVGYNVSIVEKSENYSDEEKERRIKLIQQKVDHSYNVAEKMASSCHFAVFNEVSRQDYITLAWIIGILHDIARPLQMQETGTYVDNESYSISSDIQDHDDAGAKVIFDYGLIAKIKAPLGLQYVLKETIRQHGKFEISKNLTRYSDEQITNLLLNKTLDEILKNNKTNEIEMLTYFYLRILRDIDKLDLYRQIISNEVPIVPEFIKYKALGPETKQKDTYANIASTFKIKTSDIYEANGIDTGVDDSSKPDGDIVLIPTSKLDASVVNIPLDIVNAFKNNTLPFYRELQKRRDYNFLCATIVRLNFIWKINCLETLKLIKREELLIKMYNNYPVQYQKKMKSIFDIAKNILENRIKEMENKTTKIKNLI